jgi:hypothetical protein
MVLLSSVIFFIGYVHQYGAREWNRPIKLPMVQHSCAIDGPLGFRLQSRPIAVNWVTTIGM